MSLHRRLTRKERDEFESLMEVRDPHFAGPMQGSISRVHGFLTSIVSGPMVMPSEWIPVVFGDDEQNAWDSLEQAQRAYSLLMRLSNEAAADLIPGGRGASVLIVRLGDGTDTVDLADDWCRGYMLGVALREEEWKEALEAPELRDAFAPILLIAQTRKSAEPDPLEDPDDYAAVMDKLPGSAAEIYDWWRRKLGTSTREPVRAPSRTVRRAGPKVSANAPCPCGSGKKYKRCCSPVRAT